MTAYNRPTTIDWLLWLAIAATVFFLVLAAPRGAAAQDRYDATKRPDCTEGNPLQVWLLNESSATDCDTTAGGSTPALCCCDGDASPAWAACASGGSPPGSNSFETIDTPSGTDPVADSSTDTLQILSGAAALSITGSSLADSVTFDLSGTSSRCARFDGSGELVAASGDCSAGDTGTAITLDLGDDGGNDSTSLSEMATSGDDHSAITEPSADKALIDFAKIPPYRQYDPDRPPASAGTGGWREDFTGNAETTASAWANQGSSTVTFEYDTAFFRGDTTNQFRTRYVAAPANADQTLMAKIHHVYQATTNLDSCGIGLVNGGSEASPTATAFLYYGNFATDGIAFAYDTDYDPAAGIVQVGSTASISIQEQSYNFHYLRLRYTDSTRALEGAWSRDGIEFYVIGTTTLASDPISWHYNVRREGQCRFWWWQLRTDANRNQASD